MALKKQTSLATQVKSVVRSEVKRAIKKNIKEKSFDNNASLSFGDWLDLNRSISNLPERPQFPFSQSGPVFICVNEIIKTCRSIQMVLSNADDQIVESGPAYELLYTNKETPLTKLISDTAGYLALYHECYWVFKDIDILTPKQILVAGPQQVIPIIMGGELVGYHLMTLTGRYYYLSLEEVWPMREFNPYPLLLPFHSISPTQAGSVTISASYQADLMNEATLANGGKLSGLITTPPGTKLDDDQIRALRSQFESMHKGAKNAGKWAIATGGVDIKTLSQTLVDLQMIDMRRYDATAIGALFGVPPELVGLNGEAQYAHGPAQQRFLLNTISPLLAYIAENITLGILSKFKYRKHIGKSIADAKTIFSKLSLRKRASYQSAYKAAQLNNTSLFAWFNVEEHPTIQQLLQERTEKILKYQSAGVPLNQLVKVFDLPFELVPWGDTVFYPMGMVPAETIMENAKDNQDTSYIQLPQNDDNETNKPEKPNEPLAEKPEKPKKSFEQFEDPTFTQIKNRIWNNYKASWSPLEKEYTQTLRSYFMREQRIVIDNLKAAIGDKKAFTKDGDADEIIAKVMFDIRSEKGKIKVIHQTFFQRGVDLGLRQGLSEVGGFTGDSLEQQAEALKNSVEIMNRLTISTAKIQGIVDTTKKLLVNQLKDGLQNGEGLSELSQRVRDTLGNNRARALSIARTSVGGAVSTGRFEGMKSSGLEKKSWLSAEDEHVRHTHRDAEVAYKDGIPINEPFWVGGEALMYPGDPGGSAGNIINCRCLLLAVRAAGKSFTLETYSKHKFYSYYDMKKAA